MALRHYLPLGTDSMGSRAALEEGANDPRHRCLTYGSSHWVQEERRDIVQPIGSIY